MGVVGVANSWMVMEIIIPIVFAILIDRQNKRESIMIGMRIEMRMKIE